MASGCRDGHHFVTVNQRQTREREVKRLCVNVCVCARLSPGPSIQHRPLFSSHSDKLIHPPFLFLLLFFPSSSQWGCPFTDSAEKKRDVVPGKKRGRERKRWKERGNEESD